MANYFESNDKKMCFGCESCAQTCPKDAITMIEDSEGFRYPVVDEDKCIHCGLCKKVCPHENMPFASDDDKYAFGGYHIDDEVRGQSTSGGAFSAIVDAYCDDNYVVFGATAEALRVYHKSITDKTKINDLRKSKYSQSSIGDTYKEVKEALKDNKKVLFSGTPCQMAGLKAYLQNVDTANLLTVEVICEGVPSPLYVRKLDEYLEKKYGSKIADLDYRYTDMKSIGKYTYGKWDFEIMKVILENGKELKKDRWFNPYWKLWLNHLMSRPSCYECLFTTTKRQADITLGDLWGVHLYCPELYGNNKGASLVICNTEKGKKVFENAKKFMYGHELKFEEALKYQGPLKKNIAYNDDRDEFIKDLQTLDYKSIIEKWYNKPSFKLLVSKYVWGNRQKIFIDQKVKKLIRK